MQVKRTTMSPYHPQTNAQVEVCNKTVAQYLKTQVESNTLDWELYMAPMMFAYNTSFHRTIKTSPLKLTFGHNARTINFQENTKHYGEDKGTELLQTMQTKHEKRPNNLQKKPLKEMSVTMTKRHSQENSNWGI